jgi:predicted TIM-barrel enzyme
MRNSVQINRKPRGAIDLGRLLVKNSVNLQSYGAMISLSDSYIHGFYGASSMERLPTEIAIQQKVTHFMQLKMK